MSDIINDAQEAFEDGLKVAAESTTFIGAIETGNMPIAITTGTALLSDVQSFIKDSVKIFNDGKEIFEDAKAEVNSPEFKQFQTDLEGVKAKGAKLFDDIKNKKYGDIPDDLAECVKKLKDAVSEASELTTDFVKNVLGQDTVKSAEAVILPLIPDAGKVLDSNAAKSAAELFKEMLHPDKAKMQSSAAQSATPNKNTVKGPGVRG